ncbi:MAG: elongation factor P [Patescibacteria group bacterium]|nr:elongation factor P [Patescibacteria group bacterium]
MAVLSYSDVTPKKIIVLDGEPYEVLSSHVFRMQMRKPVNQTKLRGLKTGRVVERSFHQAETVVEADIEREDITFLYAHRGEYWFSEKGNPKNRFKLDESLVGDQAHFLKQNSDIEAIRFEEEVIGIKLPVKLELKVTEAPPAIKGNTAQGGTKQVTLETGAVVSTPMFINEGDVVRVNTETGEYVERVEKA